MNFEMMYAIFTPTSRSASVYVYQSPRMENVPRHAYVVDTVVCVARLGIKCVAAILPGVGRGHAQVLAKLSQKCAIRCIDLCV